jgi:hypothetical protein
MEPGHYPPQAKDRYSVLLYQSVGSYRKKYPPCEASQLLLPVVDSKIVTFSFLHPSNGR